MILLRYIIVYKDRLEIFINVLPLADSTEDLLITDEDLTTYGLLEPNENQKTADNDGFPSENSFGELTPLSNELASPLNELSFVSLFTILPPLCASSQSRTHSENPAEFSFSPVLISVSP